MKKVTWKDVLDIKTDEPATKEDYEKGIKWAEDEIEEYEAFIEECKKRITSLIK